MKLDMYRETNIVLAVFTLCLIVKYCQCLPTENPIVRLVAELHVETDADRDKGTLSPWVICSENRTNDENEQCREIGS